MKYLVFVLRLSSGHSGTPQDKGLWRQDTSFPTIAIISPSVETSPLKNILHRKPQWRKGCQGCFVKTLLHLPSLGPPAAEFRFNQRQKDLITNSWSFHRWKIKIKISHKSPPQYPGVFQNKNLSLSPVLRLSTSSPAPVRYLLRLSDCQISAHDNQSGDAWVSDWRTTE